MLLNPNYILQLTDLVTGRRCALRTGPDDSALPLGQLLDRYLKNCPISRLIEEGRITAGSVEGIEDLQDFVYLSSNNGQLGEMFADVAFRQGDELVELDSVPQSQPARVGETEVTLTDIAIDRWSVGYDRNWTGFHRRRWDRHAGMYSAFVMDALRRRYSESEAEDVLQLDTAEQKLKLVHAVAKRIWESDFESYSRFLGRKLPYKTGDETVRNIIEGGGGICSEKVQALRFITDHYGLPCEYLLAGADARAPVPEHKLRELLTTFDFRFSRRYMRYWQHAALLYSIDGSTALVDATNGNIPFLFLQDEATESILGYDDKQPVRVRMAVMEEDFYYHRVSQDIAEDLFFAMEGWIQDADLVQVFDNELGLYISSDFFVTPVMFKNSAQFQRLEQEYLKASAAAGLPCTVSQDWTLDFPSSASSFDRPLRQAQEGPRTESGHALGRQFLEQEAQTAEKLLPCSDHLLERYARFHGPGYHAGLAIIGLRTLDGILPHA